MQIIPAIDLKDNKCVRLSKGKDNSSVVYNEDPEKNKSAVKFDNLSFDDVLKKGLKIMDTTAFTLSQENKLPIIVFDMNTKGNLSRIVQGEKIGTRVDF